MLTGIIGEKLAMSQKFDKKGRVFPATQILAGPVTVVQVKTRNRQGYSAVQLGFGVKKRTTKPILEHIKKAGLKKTPKILAEFKMPDLDLPKTGKTFNVGDIFQPGDLVTVSARSKGKGFTGVMKRWGFSGGPASHGQTDRARAPGSIGQSTTPGRVAKGKKMAGRAGGKRVTITNLQVLEVNSNKNLLVLSGSVPGSRNSILRIEKTGKAKKVFEPYVEEDKEETKETNATKEVKEEKNAEKS